MTTRLLAFVLASLVPAAAAAQHFHHHLEPAPGRLSVCVKPYAPAELDWRLPNVPWEVKSTSELAKRHFRQGMALYYGFNYEDALRNFRYATDLDGTFVMGWWGRALAAGPNINLDIDDDCMKWARTWSGTAWSLAQQQYPQGGVEYDLAHALMIRYAGSKVATDEYADAMASVWAKVAAAAHPEVGALYAESLMDKWPWDLWNPDGTEKHIPDTHDVLTVLRAVIAKHSEALGAHHYYVHAVEAGPHPDQARDSAQFLKDKAGSSGHLQHMPSHTWLLMGDYKGAVDANRVAIRYDRELGVACLGRDGKTYDEYIKDPKCMQVYFGHYLAHNFYFRAVAKAFLGNFAGDPEDPDDKTGAEVDARSTREHVEYFVANEPGLQRYMTAWLMLSVAYGTWGEILDKDRNALPPEACYSAPFKPTGCRILRSMWYWAQGMAHTSTQPPDLAASRRERDLFLE